MKATDLRIGNLILFHPINIHISQARICEVISISIKSCIVKDKGLELEMFYDNNTTHSIPLTEEWMEKFGFKSEITTNGRRVFRNYNIGTWLFVDAEDNKFTLCIDSIEEGLGWQALPYVITHNIHSYVHQLQNLYFALTGEELKQTP